MAYPCEQCGNEIPEGSPFGICPRCCFSAPSEGEEELIEGIELGEMIGEGAFGNVYAGLQLDFSLREVAVKIMREGGLERSRFLEEMQILALLKHPNIAQLIGSGETRDGRPYYLMELIEGVPLDEYQGETLPVIIQIAEAVSHAHRHGIIHRDLKPGNVLVTDEGVVKVIDFGIARVIAGPISLARAATENHRIGTPLYMSPEQLEGDPQIDTRTDIHALGLLFYELRLGRPVLHEVVSPERSWSENATRLRDFDFPKIPPREFDWVARQACAPDRRDRYQSADALLKDLRSIQNGTIVSAGAKSRCYLATRFLKKYRNFLTLITLVALLLVSVTGLSLSMAARDRKAKEKIATSMSELQKAEHRTRIAASDARLREANLALGRDDAVEALAIVNLALDLNSENGEARYFKTFLLATRTFAKPEVSPEVAFEISGIEAHANGFRVVSASGDSALISVPKTKLRHPLADIQLHDEHGLVTFASKINGESLISPILYGSGSGVSCFSPKTGRLATFTKEEGLGLWDVSRMHPPAATQTILPAISWLSFEREKNTLWMVGKEADLYLWPDLKRSFRLTKMKGFEAEFFERFSMESRLDYLWTFWQGGNQRGLAGSKMQNLRAMLAIGRHTRARNTSVMISTMARDRDVITIVDSAGAIGIRNNDGDLEFLGGPLIPVKRVSLSADGGIGAALLETGELTVFSPSSKDYLNRWKPEGSPRCLALSDDGQTLIVGMGNGDIHLFDPRTGREIREKTITRAVNLEIAVVPGRQEFITRSDGDLHLRRWDLRTGELLHSGMRHEDGVLWFSCSIDGKFLFSIDQKEIDPTRGFLRVWSLRSGQEIVPALAHDSALNCATIYENGRRIATAADDGTVRRWTIAEE